MKLRHFIDTQDFTAAELLELIELTRLLKKADRQGCTPRLLEGAALASALMSTSDSSVLAGTSVFTQNIMQYLRGRRLDEEGRAALDAYHGGGDRPGQRGHCVAGRHHL
ncbi:MAG: hypothetical protein ACUVS6_01795 [Anaerolineae bacterium]